MSHGTVIQATELAGIPPQQAQAIAELSKQSLVAALFAATLAPQVHWRIAPSGATVADEVKLPRQAIPGLPASATKRALLYLQHRGFIRQRKTSGHYYVRPLTAGAAIWPIGEGGAR